MGDLCGLDSGGSSSLKFDSHDSTTASMIQKPKYAILGVALFRILVVHSCLDFSKVIYVDTRCLP